MASRNCLWGDHSWTCSVLYTKYSHHQESFYFQVWFFFLSHFSINLPYFRQRFVSKVNHRINEILDDYILKYKKKKKSKKNLRESCELVCVHIRRGDHLEYETLNGAAHLKKHYFLQAMDTYKEQLKHPVFIIVTDDPHWAHSQIHKSFKPYFTGKI